MLINTTIKEPVVIVMDLVDYDLVITNKIFEIVTISYKAQIATIDLVYTCMLHANNHCKICIVTTLDVKSGTFALIKDTSIALVMHDLAVVYCF